jgi:Na+-transporting NADH:ubiquinone oxidoreductase subunit C
MVVIVGALLAFTASSLAPNIKQNEELEKQQNILYAMGVNENDESSAVFVSTDKVEDLFKKYVSKQLEVQDGKVIENEKAFLIDVKKEQANAKSGKVRRLPLFVGSKDGKTFYIAPVRGKGLWDAIWGYVSLDENMTVQGAIFDHKGETPGLGANITQRFFMDDFIGESLVDAAGNFKGISVLKGNNDPKNDNKTDNEVDAIAGATITGNGVTAMLKADLKLYEPFFKSLKK